MIRVAISIVSDRKRERQILMTSGRDAETSKKNPGLRHNISLKVNTKPVKTPCTYYL